MAFDLAIRPVFLLFVFKFNDDDEDEDELVLDFFSLFFWFENFLFVDIVVDFDLCCERVELKVALFASRAKQFALVAESELDGTLCDLLLVEFIMSNSNWKNKEKQI